MGLPRYCLVASRAAWHLNCTRAACCENPVQAAAAEDVCNLGCLFLFAAEEDFPLSSPESVLTKT